MVRLAGCTFALFLAFLGARPSAAILEGCVSFCSDTVQIIGCDDRTQGPLDASAAVSANAPWRHVGRLDGGGSGGCTGTLIGPKHVLTAAHCVIDKFSQFRNGSIRFRLAQYDTCGQPYGTYYAVRAFVPSAYVGGDLSPENKAWDYAVIELNNPIAGAVPMAFDYLSWNILQPLTAYSVGYPGDKPASTLWQTGSNNDFLDSPYRYLGNGDRGLLYVTTDGALGQSGSAVYAIYNGQRVITGVFIGAPSDDCLAGRSWAARLTPGAVERIENAMQYPGVLDLSLRWRNIPLAQVLPDEPPAFCN